jgi:2'-5' RNA ligase
MPSHEGKRRRLFFALWPDDALRVQLSKLNSRIGAQLRGRKMRAENLHITLAFIGSVDESICECLQQMATTIQIPPFQLALDQLGHFPKPRVIWIGSNETPEPLQSLVTALKRAMLECGLEPEKRPFHTHLTLMRKVAKGIEFEQLQPLRWAVNDFCLVESHTLPEGVQYQVVQRWPLQ